MLKTILILITIIIAFLNIACKENLVGPSFHFLSDPGPILFVSNQDGSFQLYSMNEDGSNVRQLTNDPNSPISDARWSPDGTKIAIVSMVGDKMTYPMFRNAIFIVDANGNNKYQLTSQWFTLNDSEFGSMEYGGAFYPVWSPDSKQIAFSRLMIPESIANMDVFIIDADGTNEKIITRTATYTEGCHDWSENLLLVSRIDWSARDSAGRAIQHTTVDIMDTEGDIIYSFGKPGESWKTPQWGINNEEFFFSYSSDSLKQQQRILKYNVRNKIITIIMSNDFKRYGLVTINTGRILFNAPRGMNLNNVLITSENGTSKNITPFDAEVLTATSWRR